MKLWKSIDEMPSPVIPDLSKVTEEDLNEAYVRFWKKDKKDPEICEEIPCVHVSEITYGTPRRDIIAPTMLLGLEAEEGLCARYREVGFKADKIWFVCKKPSTYAVKLDTDEGEAILIGNVDAWLWLPKEYGGPALLPIEKKTGLYRANSSYGWKKSAIAVEQGLIYSWLSRVGGFVIQHDAKDTSKYLIKHDLYRAEWPKNEEEFVEAIKRRVEIALREKRNGSNGWRDKLRSEASLSKFYTRVGVKNLVLFLKH